jgi:hypothetical protein
MFGTSHPQPPHRKEVAMQIVQQERKTFASTELTIDMPDDSDVGAPPPDQPIRFSVSYALIEYLSMVREHVAFLLRHEAPAVKRRRVLVPLACGATALALAGAVALADGPGWASILLLALGGMALASLPVTASFWVALLATPVFLLKKRRTPVSDVTIDRRAIERSSTRGEFRRNWDEVKSVRRYSRGYLLVFERGALPIPFRCMNTGQQERFRAFALARGPHITPA